MTRLTIRQSGGASIVSIPKAVLKTLDLHTGSTVELSLKNDNIILTPSKKEMTLDELLVGSPKRKLALSNEDKQWLDSKPVGKEE